MKIGVPKEIKAQEARVGLTPAGALTLIQTGHSVSIQKAKFSIGDIVKHKHFDFRGVIYDVDFEFNNSEEWYQSIPKNVRPRKNQPFYHLLAENDDVTYEAYVSEQNLLVDDSNIPVEHPDVPVFFGGFDGDSYELLENSKN